MRVLPVGVFSTVLLLACLPKHEALAKKAESIGDVATAAAEYDRAMADVPMMDFEYERARKARKRLMEGEWSPRVDALLGMAPSPTTAAYAAELFELRKAAFSAGIPEQLSARIDGEVLRAVSVLDLAAREPAEVEVRLAELLDLFDAALASGAPQEPIDTVVAAFGQSVSIGFPAPGPSGGLDRLGELLDLRAALRQRNFPEAFDAALAGEFDRAGSASYPPPTVDNAVTSFDRALSLRRLARALGAPSPAIALADRAETDARALIFARTDEESAAHRYLPLYDALLPLSAQVEPGHPLVARLARVASEGAVWHATQAEALPPGYRRLLHLRAAASLSGEGRLATAERARLEPSFATSLALTPPPASTGPCGPMESLVGAAFPKGALPTLLTSMSSQCIATSRDSVSSRQHGYVADELYYVQENVQIGTDLVVVQTGTREVGYQENVEGGWVYGVRQEPVYENRLVPIYELRDIEKHRDVQRSVTYSVTTREVVVEISGAASIVWTDGTTLSTPFSQRHGSEASSWAYDVPGHTDADPVTHLTQSISPSHSVIAIAPAVAGAAATELHGGLSARVRAHRAKLARDEGRLALGGGDGAAAGEAFVRSVLHDGKAEGEAASWFQTEFGLAAAVVEGLLAPRETVRAAPIGLSFEVATRYLSSPIVVGAGAPLRADKAVASVSTESYQAGVLPPNEFIDGHVGLAPSEIQTGSEVGSRIAPVMVGFDAHYGVLESLLKLRYGPVIHDQLGLRFTFGMTYVDKVEYADGEEEGPIALSVDPSYALYGGLR